MPYINRPIDGFLYRYFTARVLTNANGGWVLAARLHQLVRFSFGERLVSVTDYGERMRLLCNTCLDHLDWTARLWEEGSNEPEMTDEGLTSDQLCAAALFNLPDWTSSIINETRLTYYNRNIRKATTRPDGSALVNLPLVFAAAGGHAELVKRILLARQEEYGTCKAPEAFWILRAAIVNCQYDVVKVFLATSEEIDYDMVITAACWALQQNDLRMFRLLCQDYDLHLSQPRLLVEAARRGFLDVVEEGLRCRAAARRIRYQDPRFPLAAAARGGHVEIIRLLLTQGVGSNDIESTCRSGLGWAAMSGHLRAMQMLLDAGAVHPNGPLKTDPLYQASANGQHHVVEYLIQRGGDLTGQRTIEHNGKPVKVSHFAICEAAQRGYASIVRLLAEAGVKMSWNYIEWPSPPMISALRFGQPQVVRTLLALGHQPILSIPASKLAWDNRPEPLPYQCHYGIKPVLTRAENF